MDYGLCGDCFKKLSFITKPFCKSCNQPFVKKSAGKYCGGCLKSKPNYILRSPVIYNDNSAPLILKFKHGDGTHIAKYLASEMVKSIDDVAGDIDIIMPVPLHRTRLVKRKYNQSAELTKIIAKQINKPHNMTNLVRTKNTQSQGNKNFRMRVKNVRGAFAIKNKENIADKTILIVDDVHTTGATLTEISKLLLKNGAKQIYAVCYAKVVK